MSEMGKIFKNARQLAEPFRVTGGDFRLKDIDPGDTLDLKSEDKPREQEALATGIQALTVLQDMLYAQDRWGLLLIFQAMDAAGKDSAIKHVMSGVNPQGVEVHSFKSPSAEERNHDYLWRRAGQEDRQEEGFQTVREESDAPSEGLFQR
jgi:polyphosphate kinase 2 (PPK2 family)